MTLFYPGRKTEVHSFERLNLRGLGSEAQLKEGTRDETGKKKIKRKSIEGPGSLTLSAART